MLLAVLLCCVSAQAAEFVPTPLSEVVGGDLNRRWKQHWDDQSGLARRTYVDGYAKHGKHGAWDSEVDKLLKAMCGSFVNPRTVAVAAQAAIKAGCTDPFVRYRVLVDRHNASNGMMIARDGDPAGGAPASVAAYGGDAPPVIGLLDIGDEMTQAGYSPLMGLSALKRGIAVMTMEDHANAALCDRIVATAVKVTLAVITEVGDDRAMLDDVFFDREIILGEHMNAGTAGLPLLRHLVAAVGKASVGLDPWWQDVLIGGYQANISFLALHNPETSSQAPTARSLARPRLERAAQARPDRVYPAAMLMRLASYDRPQEMRRWFEAAVHADPMQQMVQSMYIESLTRATDPVGALLDLGCECADIRGQQLKGCIMNCLMRAVSVEQDPGRLWKDPRMWRMLDGFTGEEKRSQGDRLAFAWRCGQKAEAVRLWQMNPKLRASPPILQAVGAQQEEITRACSIWAAEPTTAGPATMEPAPKTGDF